MDVKYIDAFIAARMQWKNKQYNKVPVWAVLECLRIQQDADFNLNDASEIVRLLQLTDGEWY